MVLLQFWHFFQVVILANIGEENVLFGILERKDAFMAIQRKS